MPSNRSGKRTRVPWRRTTNPRGAAITMPVFMAYCAIAATLRAWNKPKLNSIITLKAHEDFYFPVYADAARHFVWEIWKPDEVGWDVFEWKESLSAIRWRRSRTERRSFSRHLTTS
ncbi:hypothetical protein FHT28_003604 [Rhizobium sp. SG570]|nr:hypothetical protein [Rhizobium sp. SG570]